MSPEADQPGPDAPAEPDGDPAQPTPDAPAQPDGETAQPDGERAACTACRGTGRVLRTQGEKTEPVTCPWCDGSGKFIPGRDAQAARVEQPEAG